MNLKSYYYMLIFCTQVQLTFNSDQIIAPPQESFPTKFLNH